MTLRRKGCWVSIFLLLIEPIHALQWRLLNSQSPFCLIFTFRILNFRFISDFYIVLIVPRSLVFEFFENLTKIEIFWKICLKSKLYENFDQNRIFLKNLTIEIFQKIFTKIEFFSKIWQKSKIFENFDQNRDFFGNLTQLTEIELPAIWHEGICQNTLQRSKYEITLLMNDHVNFVAINIWN